MRFFNITLLYIILHLIVSCKDHNATITKPQKTYIHENQEQFLETLATICGQAFMGTIINGSPSDTAFNDKILVMHVRSCQDGIIKIPFFVGADSSRTWVISKTNHGIQLKHDHRHEDGTPDEVTMYGGHTSNGGSATRQLFPADQETADILPQAIGNIWWIDIKKDSIFTYNLRRVNTDRLFSVEFDLTRPLPTVPGAPWGWQE